MRKVKVLSCVQLFVTHGLQSPWNSPGQNTGVSRYWKISRGSSHPGIESRSPSLQADSLPAEPLGKPKNTGMGSLSLLQGIFQLGSPALQVNSYQLSYQGSPTGSFYDKSLLLLFLLVFFCLQ